MAEATASYSRLASVVNDLSFDEVLAALDLESRSRRRKSIINRLIARCIRIREIELQKMLTEEYGGTRGKAQEHPAQARTPTVTFIATEGSLGRKKRDKRSRADRPRADRNRARARKGR